MVNNCANPQCAKPLHYLRDGRIFVFEVPDSTPAASPDGKRTRHLEHYWLCGQCAQQFQIDYVAETGVQLAPRHPVRSRGSVVLAGSALAS